MDAPPLPRNVKNLAALLVGGDEGGSGGDGMGY